MALHFDTSDTNQMLCYDFLNRYPKLKTKIVTLIVNDFIENYNIQDISQQEMRDFIRFFPRIKSAIERTSPHIFQAIPHPSVSKQAEVQAQESIIIQEEPETFSSEPTASAEEMARMDAALAMFFTNDD